MKISKIEIDFPIDVEIPETLIQAIDKLITNLVCKPYKEEHPDRTMWVSGHGAKMICSHIDSMLLRKREYDETIPDGDEPVFDESIYEISITERENY